MWARRVTGQLGLFLRATAIGICRPKLLLFRILLTGIGKKRERLGIRRPCRIGIDSFSGSFKLHHRRARIARGRANVSLFRSCRGG